MVLDDLDEGEGPVGVEPLRGERRPVANVPLAEATFIKGAKRRLVIWDPKVTDPRMIQLIRQRMKAGVDVRILGKVGKRGGDLPVQKLDGSRLHVRAMVRDGETAFVGSQSLRALELDARREVGLIVRDRGVVRLMLEVFDEDWAKARPGEKKKKHAGKDAVGGEDAVSA